MTIWAKRGSFVANTSTGNQAVAGVGGQGKALILKCIGRTAVGQAQGDLKRAFGVATAVADQWALSNYVQDNVASTNAGDRGDNDICIGIPLGPNTVDGEAAFVSFDADGFTINWTDAPAAAYLIEYIVLGGDGLLAKAFTFQLSTSPDGTDVDVTGIGFEPKALLMESIADSGAFPDGETTQSIFSHGVAVSASARGTISWGERDNQAASTAVTQNLERMLSQRSVLNTAVFTIDLIDFDPDGFTYDLTDGSGSAYNMYGLALGGAELGVDFRVLAQPVAPGQNVVDGLAFEPVLLHGFGTDLTAFGASATADGAFRFGAADATSEACMSARDVDAADPTDVGLGHTQSKFLRVLDAAQATLAECDATLDPAGYTLDWTSADAVARQNMVLAIGEIIPPPTVVTGAASEVGGTTATLNGTVNPNGFETEYYFEYGLDGSYGTEIPVGLDGDAGNGIVAVAVDEQLAGLTPSTTYHYRLVAVNAGGTTFGDDATFGTSGTGMLLLGV